MVQENSQGFPRVRCLISLGSNKGVNNVGPKMVLDHCLAMLDNESVTISSTSNYYSTPAFPPGSGPNFVNAVAEIRTNLTPRDLLSFIHEVEKELGRTRDVRWEQRVIDVDLLSLGETVLPDLATYLRWVNLPLVQQKVETPSELILPHPRIADRPFVLVPLRDVAPDWVHPVSGNSVDEMLSLFSAAEIAEIRPLKGGT